MPGPHAYYLPDARPTVVKAQAAPGVELIDLSLNESPFGASPKAIAAACARTSRLNRYPDPSSAELRSAIGRAFDLDAARIVCGNGSEELLDVVARMFVRPGDAILQSAHGFFQFGVVAARLGAERQLAPETALEPSVDALLASVTERTRLVFLANPNNPTGAALPRSELDRLAASLPPHVVLLVDAAYGEFMTDPAHDIGMDLPDRHENVIVTRTFSKAFGLAAMRVGWAFGPAWLMPGLNGLRGVGNVNALAQEAAVAALDDLAFMRDCVSRIAEARAALALGLEGLGLKPRRTPTNFVLTSFPGAGADVIDRLLPFLAGRRIVLRRSGELGALPALRIGVGTPAQNQILLEALEAFLELE